MSVAFILSGHADRPAEMRRLAFAAIVTAAAYACVLGAFFWLQSDPRQGTVGTPAVLIDLAPLPVTSSSQQDIAPGPDMVESAADAMKKSEVHPDVKDHPVLPDAASEVTLPKIAPKPERANPAQTVDATKNERPIEKKPPAPRTAGAPRTRSSSVNQPAAQRAAGSATVEGIESWRDLLVAQLQRNKRYPAAARGRQEHGIVVVSFVVDRRGHVLSSAITKGSGFSELDQEALALGKRAEPLPAFPPAMTQSTVRLSVPIRFSLN